MINIAVIDDEPEERARIKKCLDFVSQKRNVCFCVDEYGSTEQFLMRYDFSYDIIFLDVFFGNGKDGMSAARAIRKMDETVLLVFISNLAHMAIQGYAVDAMDFILKPVENHTFLLKMSRVLKRLGRKTDFAISVKTVGETVRLHTRLIRYLLVKGHYVEYHSREGIYSEYISLSAAEEKLNDDCFFRCDRGCLVNLRYVTEIRKETCVVDSEELPIARTQRSAFKKAFANYLAGCNA